MMTIEAHIMPNKHLLVTVSDRSQEWTDLCVTDLRGSKPSDIQAQIEPHIGRELMEEEAVVLSDAIKGAKPMKP